MNTGECDVWVDDVKDKCRILVPKLLQRRVFDNVHQLAHTKFKASYKINGKDYWWPGMSKDIANWTKSCVACQISKIDTHTKSPLHKLPPPTNRFSHIHVDLVGPLPPSENKNMLLTVIDRWTSWPEAYPLSSSGEAASSSVCAKMLIREWIPRFGVPDIITSDRGSQFVSQLCTLMGIKRDPTTAYHPQHNGELERWHRSLKNALRARLQSKRTWVQELPWVLLGLREAPNLDTGVSPSVLVTG